VGEDHAQGEAEVVGHEVGTDRMRGRFRAARSL
jgi:hypothetical protein